MKSIVVAVTLALLLIGSTFPLRSSVVAQLGAPSESIMFTVYPDTSFALAANESQSLTVQPGAEPNSTLSMNAVTVNNVTTLSLTGSESLSPTMLDQPPYNFSEASSVTGTYSNGLANGSITIHAIPGLESPISTFTLNYNGNSSAITVSGSSKVEFGNYSGVVLNKTSIATYLDQAKSEGFNQTYLDNLFSTLPYTNLQVTNLSITQQNGSSSSTINVNFQVSGNMTALPAVLATSYACIISTPGNYSSGFPSNCQSTFTAFSEFFSSVSSYNYTSSYSNGLGGFSAQLVGSNNFNLADIQQVLGSQNDSMLSTSLPTSVKVDISGLQVYYSSTEDQYGNFTTQVSMSGLTVYPNITPVGSTWNMSAIFDNFTGYQGAVTIVGGSNSQGSVSLILPSSVPAPASSTATYAKWNNVNMSELAPIEFTTGAITTSTTGQTTTTTSSQSTTGSAAATTTTTSSSGASPFNSYVLYAAIGAVAIVAVVAAVFFLSKRGPGVAPAPSAPPPPAPT